MSRIIFAIAMPEEHRGDAMQFVALLTERAGKGNVSAVVREVDDDNADINEMAGASTRGRARRSPSKVAGPDPQAEITTLVDQLRNSMPVHQPAAVQTSAPVAPVKTTKVPLRDKRGRIVKKGGRTVYAQVAADTANDRTATAPAPARASSEGAGDPLAWMRSVGFKSADAPASNGNGGGHTEEEITRNKVTYSVIRPTVKLNGVPEMIKCFILANNNKVSAKHIEETLRLKRKSVESGLWLLRDRGIVESVPVS